MNSLEIMSERCRRVARDNTTCYSIMMKLYGEDRVDIIEWISSINKTDYNAITPEQIVSVYEHSGNDIHKFIEKIDKGLKEAKKMRSNFYNAIEAEQEQIDYEFQHGIKPEDKPREFYTSKYRKYQG